MKKLPIVAALAGFILGNAALSPASTDSLKGTEINVMYEDGQSYSLSFSESEVTWKGLKGADAGSSEKDHYQFLSSAPRTYFVSWTEADGSFVSLLIDLNHGSVFSTGQAAGSTWMRKGNVISPASKGK